MILRGPDVTTFSTVDALFHQQQGFEWTMSPHCTENPNYVFPEIKLGGLIPNSYIHVSVKILYSRIGLPFWQQQNRQTDHRYMNVGKGRHAEHFNSAWK
jgi:hypothetical protein